MSYPARGPVRSAGIDGKGPAAGRRPRDAMNQHDGSEATA
jgi:hypothetical protein